MKTFTSLKTILASVAVCGVALCTAAVATNIAVGPAFAIATGSIFALIALADYGPRQFVGSTLVRATERLPLAG